MAVDAVRELPPVATSDVLRSYELSLPQEAAGALGVCARHLERLGARAVPRAGAPADRLDVAPAGVSCRMWTDTRAGRGTETAGDVESGEVLAQARSGLMAVHGRDAGAPRRLGLDVCSVAAGIAASQGVLAALVGRRRGLNASTVETSVVRGALPFLVHHLAIATSGGEFPYRPGMPAPGPPFGTADGHWVELEVLSGDDWFGFWRRLGVDRPDVVGAAWLPFVYRYLAGRCALPAELHAATRRHTLAQLRAAAQDTGVALGVVRVDGPRPDEADAPPWALRPHPAGATPAPGQTSAAGPLGGLRVVEVTSRLQGPLAGLLLGMLGAEVVKVEPPGGDFGRGSPPLAGDVGAAYLAYNRGKRVVEVDYKREAGRAELVELAATADVFLHNWRPGRAEALGLDALGAGRRNPRLVYAYASGWGGAPDAPGEIAGDYLVQAHAGVGTGLHPPGEPPFPSRVTLVDVVGGLIAAEGVLAGLYLREDTERGCRVDTSLLGAAAALRAVPRPAPPRWDGLAGPVPTADGYIVVPAGDEAVLRRLAAATASAAVPAAIGDRLRTRTTEEWLSVLGEAGVPAASVLTDLAGLPSSAGMGGLVERVDGACWAPAAPFTIVNV
jgi:CoA:oxalate CoA-transferase